ncbi:MAG: homoserine dehydrogenase [Chthonomonas sp.]|nr:homoserine dehydrogenase [Chthonomonas sp.]
MSRSRVGLIGFGTVGAAVYEQIQTNLWERFEVARVAVRDRGKARPAEIEDLLCDAQYLVQADDVDIVVEVIGGIHPAIDLIKLALTQGKRVVTANKELIARHYDELIAFGGDLRFEAAVAGGIPVIQVLRTLAQTNRITSIHGILNGTTNFILTEMETRQSELEPILKEAQAMGYAEADPTADVDGFDAMYKIAILGAIASGEQLDLETIPRSGIREISLTKMREAAEHERRIKLVASWTRESGARVTCQALPLDHPLSQVDGVMNAVTIEGDFMPTLTLIGPGAGGRPTSSAICGDLVAE